MTGQDPAHLHTSAQPAPRGRRDAVLKVITAASVAGAITGVLVLPRLLADGDKGTGAGRERAAPAVDRVVRDGDTVTGTGRVVATPGRPLRFCPSLPRAMPALAPGEEQQVERCDSFGVDVVGASLTRLGKRREVGGIVEGYAVITGVYRHGTLQVTRQSPAEGYGGPVSRPGPDHVPCPPPSGGWPSGADDIDVTRAQAYERTHAGEIVQLSVQRPAAGQTVLVLAARDPVRVRAALLPSYGKRLCVFRSPYTVEQVQEAHRRLGALVGPRGLWAGGGIGVGSNGHPQVSGEGAMLTPSFAEIAGSFPPGLVHFDTWLTRVR